MSGFSDISLVLSNLNLSALEGTDDVTPLNVGGFEITYDLSRGFNRSDYSTNWLDSDKRNTLLSLTDTRKMIAPYWSGSYPLQEVTANALFIRDFIQKVNDASNVTDYPKYKVNGIDKTGLEAVTLAIEKTQTSPATVDAGLLSHVSLPYVGTFYLCRYRSLINEPTYWRLVRSDVVPSSASSEGVTIIEGKVHNDGITLEFVAPSSPENPDPVLHQAEQAAIFEAAAIQYPGGYEGAYPFANNIGFRMRDGTDFLSSLSIIGGGFTENLNPIVDNGNDPQLPVATGQSVTCGANASGITPKNTTSITLPSGYVSYAVGLASNGTLSGIAPDLMYTPTDDFLGDDSFTFTVNDGTNDSLPATVSITVLPTLIFYNAQNIIDATKTILYGPSDLSTPLDMSILAQNSHIIHGNQKIVINNPDTSDTGTQRWPFTLFTPVVQGTEYEFSFIYSVNEGGEAEIQLDVEFHPGLNYTYLHTIDETWKATDTEKTFTTFFTPTETKKMTIHLQNKFKNVSTTTLTIKNIIVQEVAAARKTKLKAPLEVSNGKALKDAAATVNARNAVKEEILSAGTEDQKKKIRKELMESMFKNNVNLIQIPMTRTELGISSDKLKRENVVVVKSGETIDVSAVNSADESFYCPLANDGDEITLTKGVGNSLTVKRQDAGVDEKHIITTASNVVSITKGVTSYTTPAELGELVEDDVITVTFTDGNTIIFFIGSVGDGSGTESSGASGDPFLVTLL